FAFERIPQGSAALQLSDAQGISLATTTTRPAPRTLEVRAKPGPLLRLLLLSPSGAPIEGAGVELVPASPDDFIREARTNAQGRVGIPLEGPGRFRVLARWAEAGTARHGWRDFEATSRTEDTRVELRFGPPPSATLSGRVFDADGQPVPGAEVGAVELFP